MAWGEMGWDGMGRGQWDGLNIPRREEYESTAQTPDPQSRPWRVRPQLSNIMAAAAVVSLYLVRLVMLSICIFAVSFPAVSKHRRIYFKSIQAQGYRSTLPVLIK